MALYFSFKKTGTLPRGIALFKPVLMYLDSTFLPKPNRMEITDGKERMISGFKDVNIFEALEKKKHYVDLYIDSASISILFGQSRNQSSISFELPELFSKNLTIADIASLLINISRVMEVTYSECMLDGRGKYMHDKYYGTYNRTFYCSGLSWLNFFGPEEELRQGGSIIEKNPYATRIERFPEGLFMQVGHGPEDCLTPEGEELLLNATKALPPAKWSLD